MLRALGEVSRELGAGLWALLTALVPAGEGAQGAQGAAEIPVVLQLLPDPLGQAWGETESPKSQRLQQLFHSTQQHLRVQMFLCRYSLKDCKNLLTKPQSWEFDLFNGSILISRLKIFLFFY